MLEINSLDILKLFVHTVVNMKNQVIFKIIRSLLSYYIIELNILKPCSIYPMHWPAVMGSAVTQHVQQ